MYNALLLTDNNSTNSLRVLDGVRGEELGDDLSLEEAVPLFSRDSEEVGCNEESRSAETNHINFQKKLQHKCIH